MVSDYQADATNPGKPGRPSEQASERARTPHEHARRRRLTLALAVAGLLFLFAAPAGAADPVRAAGGEAAGAQRGNFAGRVEIRGGRKIYLECRGSGRPTVILVSGHGNAADIWGEKARVEWQEGLFPELFPGLDLPVRGPAVMRGVARLTRVCAYDRPNNRLLDGRPSRSDPVPQPATAGSSVADLHALLRAARVPGPYLLVGHSFGGLIVRLYATTYPRQVAGLVSVDASTEFQRELLTPQQNALVDQLLLELDSVPGIDPPLEIADFNTSFDQMLRAKAARPLRPTLPMVVLTRGLPQLLPPDLVAARPPGFPDQDTNERTWRMAQGWLAALVPYARHVIARKSEHYIQTEQPRLVIDAVRRELRMVRPTTVRCRGGGDSCRARVSLAGGASHKRVTIELSDTDLRLVSVRPNRRSLRGAYGLFGQRLRSGGSQYLVRLNAVQSIPPGSDLIFTFRASGGR
jgi:pimeloyl-ACP methyl ester carboxylesterase